MDVAAPVRWKWPAKWQEQLHPSLSLKLLASYFEDLELRTPQMGRWILQFCWFLLVIFCGLHNVFYYPFFCPLCKLWFTSWLLTFLENLYIFWSQVSCIHQYQSTRPMILTQKRITISIYELWCLRPIPFITYWIPCTKQLFQRQFLEVGQYTHTISWQLYRPSYIDYCYLYN